MERKKLKQQKISFVDSIFNSSVAKLAISLKYFITLPYKQRINTLKK